jgi:hypothetical protein
MAKRKAAPINNWSGQGVIIHLPLHRNDKPKYEADPKVYLTISSLYRPN